MRHYEIVLLIHPDQSEQVPAMLERYKGMITAGGGAIVNLLNIGAKAPGADSTPTSVSRAAGLARTGRNRPHCGTASTYFRLLASGLTAWSGSLAYW